MPDVAFGCIIFVLFSQMCLKDVRNISRSKQPSTVVYGLIQWNHKNIHNENSWEGPEHLVFAYKITVFNFHMYPLWEQVLFASPVIGEKNENANYMKNYTDKVVKPNFDFKLRPRYNMYCEPSSNWATLPSVICDPVSENNLGQTNG